MGGAMSRNKGAAFERTLAKFLRPTFPSMERAVRTGYRTADRTSADPGDLAGTDYVVWSAKDAKSSKGHPEPEVGQLRGWMTELELMVRGSTRTPTPIGVLVHKRAGHADPAMAWAWVTVTDLLRVQGLGETVLPSLAEVPVRLTLGQLMPALAAWERRHVERAA